LINMPQAYLPPMLLPTPNMRNGEALQKGCEFPVLLWPQHKMPAIRNKRER